MVLEQTKKAKKVKEEQEEKADQFAYLSNGYANEDDAWGEASPDYSAKIMERMNHKSGLNSLLEDKDADWQATMGNKLEEEGKEVQLVQMHGLWIRR